MYERTAVSQAQRKNHVNCFLYFAEEAKALEAMRLIIEALSSRCLAQKSQRKERTKIWPQPNWYDTDTQKLANCSKNVYDFAHCLAAADPRLYGNGINIYVLSEAQRRTIPINRKIIMIWLNLCRVIARRQPEQDKIS